MNKFVLVISSAIIVLLISSNTMACSCRRDPAEKISSAVAKELRRSVLVFSGIALERNRSGLRFRVERVWKGKARSEIIFHSKLYAAQDTNDKEIFVNSCVLQFDVGKKYLVYADREDGELFVNKCSRTQVLDGANKDIVELDRLNPAKLPTYTACGCGCCDGPSQVRCLYRSKGDDLQKVIEADRKKAANIKRCAVAGCSIPIKYRYCD